MRRTVLVIVVCTCCCLVRAQEPSTSPPVDKPVAAPNQEAVRKLEEAIAPYVKKARATLPEVKKRYLKGLPEGQRLLLTTRLYEPSGRFEQVFITVRSWKGKKINGVLSSDTRLIHLKSGDEIGCNEQDVLDWTIVKPDGSEEGNFVGKFLDTYQP